MTSVGWNDLIQSASQSMIGQVVTDGEYVLELTKAEAKHTSNKKQMIDARFKIHGGAYNGAHLRTNFVLSPESPDASAIFLRDMAAFGITDEYLRQNNPTIEAIAANLIGRYVKVSVSTRKYKNNKGTEVTVNDLNNFMPAAPGSATQAAPAATQQPAQQQPPPPAQQPAQQPAQPPPLTAVPDQAQPVQPPAAPPAQPPVTVPPPVAPPPAAPPQAPF